MSQRIVYDVCGVPGLNIMYEAFSEDFEQQLFELGVGRSRVMPWKTSIERRYSSWFGVSRFPKCFWRLINLIRDFRLTHEPLILPDSVTAITYPLGSRIGAHFDPAAKLGDVLIGISTGMEATMYLTQDRKFGSGKVTFALPRRSIYVLESDARYRWQHGLLALTQSLAGLPAWNPCSERRSFIFRQTMTWAQHVLRHPVPLALGNHAGCGLLVSARLASLESLDKVPKKRKQNQQLHCDRQSKHLPSLPWDERFPESTNFANLSEKPVRAIPARLSRKRKRWNAYILVATAHLAELPGSHVSIGKATEEAVERSSLRKRQKATWDGTVRISHMGNDCIDLD